MFTGLMWLDDSGRPWEEKVRQAVARYEDRFGKTPELCLVHKALLPEGCRLDRVEVRPVAHVSPHHFWVGIEREARAAVVAI